MPEDPQIVSISASTPLSPDEVARKSFPAVRKGIDGEAVHLYLAKVAAELRGVLEREAILRERLAEAERRAADPELDEATLTKAIGVETARILSTAHEAARNTVAKAEEQAAELVGRAKGVLDEQVALAEAAAATIRAAAEQDAHENAGRAQAESEALTEEAHADAVELLDATKEECRRMVAEARDLRNRTLSELVARRRTLRVQLEELRGGKDSLLQVVDTVGAAVEQLRERLVTAEQEARLAAEDAGGRAEEHAAGDELGELETELAAVGRTLGGEAPPAAEPTPGEEPGAEGEPAAGTRPGTAEAPGDATAGRGYPSASRRSVDELFARIRASRAAEEAAAVAAEAGTAAAVAEAPAAAGASTSEAVEAAAPAGETEDTGKQPAAVEAARPEVAETVEAAEATDEAAPAGGNDEGRATPPLVGTEEHTAEYEAVALRVEVTEAAESSPALGVPAGEGASSEEARTEGLETTAVATAGVVFDVEALEADALGDGAGPGNGDVTGGEAAPGAVGAAAGPAVSRRRGDAITEPDVESLARRDHLLGPVTAKLGRALKRALQDDQNDLLTALRQTNRKPVLDELAPVGGQLQRFVAAAGEHLAKAYEAGAAFLVHGDSVEGPSVSAPPPSETTSFQAGTALAAELADALSGMLRQRIEEALSELDGSLEGSADAAGVAYREWKGSRVEGLAGDFTTRAFAVGELAVLESVAKGGRPLVRWAVEDDDGGGSCPDCEDNALAGALVPGTGFPTGHPHPPVHPGCRCLLVPVRS